MATTSLTPAQDTVLAEVYIAAPPERVFQAITDPRQMLQWWGEKGMYRCTHFETDVRVNGRWLSVGESANGENFQVSGEYLEVDPLGVLVYTWIASWTGALKTTVRWELEPHKGGTDVRICHSGFAGSLEAAKDTAKDGSAFSDGCKRSSRKERPSTPVNNAPESGNDSRAVGDLALQPAPRDRP